ncbi:hypothetical protein OIU81_03235 [Streptomyces sp. NBC_01454]|uniref:hypothetical protein n=1 Tax=Streptomyces sp. NBC_01454 TaxID=2975867 RepID=UPI002E33F68D|nr:hypothetical protein [Streptomyces sp. NBC_01454]
MYTPTRAEVADVFDGVGVLDFEDHEAALTHDREKAIAALDAFHRLYCEESLADMGIVPDRDMATGWARFESRTDGKRTVDSGDQPDHPAAFPVTWLYL